MSAVRYMTRIGLVALLSALALLIVISEPQAQLRFCGEHEVFIKKLEKKYKEKRRSFGITSDGRLLELFVGPSGTWTILITIPGGPTCVLSDGGNWREIEPKEEDPLA